MQRVIILALLCLLTPAFAASPLTVLYDSGNTQPLAPLLADPAHSDCPDARLCVGYGCEFFVTQRMVVTTHHKYVFNGFGIDELYDLRNDPTESDDRAAAYPRRLERMVRAWQAYAEQNGVAVYDRDLGYGRYFRRQQ